MNNNRSVSGTQRAYLYNAGIDDTQSQKALKTIIELKDQRIDLLMQILNDYKTLVKLFKEKDEKRNEA